MSDEKQPTPEELHAYREKMLKFYNEEIPLLSKLKEYELLKAEIEESRLRRVAAAIKMAQITAAPEDNPISENNSKVRQLKKDPQ
jgi:hypothetical protein